MVQIEWTIDKFEKDCNTAFQKSHKRAFKANLAREDIAMLKQVRRDKKNIIGNTDKNLGPSIMEIDLYIRRAWEDHLLDSTTYKKLTKFEADIINDNNFQWICDNILDHQLSIIPTHEKKFFMDTLQVPEMVVEDSTQKKQPSYHIFT